MTVEYIFTYQTICEANGKNYVGVHKTTDLNDGYIGCGVFSQSDAKKGLLFQRAVKKYGYASFRRHILSFFDTYEEALEEESFMVNDKWIKDKNNYNTAIGGKGNTILWMDAGRKEQWKSNISDKVNLFFKNGGRGKVMAGLATGGRSRMFGAKNPRYGNGNPAVERAVFQFDKSGNLLKEFKTMSEASSELGLAVSNICYCCKGKYHTCGGFVFKYKEGGIS